MQSVVDKIHKVIAEASLFPDFPDVTRGEMPDAKLHVAFGEVDETKTAIRALISAADRRSVPISRAEIGHEGSLLVLRVA